MGKVYLKEENLGSGRLQAKKWLLRNFFENLLKAMALVPLKMHIHTYIDNLAYNFRAFMDLVES